MRHPNKKKKVKNTWIKRYWNSGIYLAINEFMPKNEMILNNHMGDTVVYMTKETYKKLVKESRKIIIWRGIINA